MSKFLAMGVSVTDIISRTTWMPAQLIHHPEHGHITVGAAADIAVLRIADGDWGYADSSGGRLAGRQRFFAEMTLLGGEIVWDWNARAAVPYQSLGPEYGLRPGADFIVRPPAH